jgi:hypothetical protein
MTRQNLFALSLGFAALILTAQAARAEPQQCGARDAVIARLSTGYGETRRSVGLAANNAVLEVFASDTTGTWTVTVTLPTGMTCLVASGDNYQTLAAAPQPPGDDA